MALTMQERQHVGREVALRYLRARKKENGIMLREFCATTGYSPPYAAYLLRTSAKRVILGSVTLVPTRPSPWRRQRKHVVGPVVVEALVWVEHLAGELCEGRLQEAILELLRAALLHLGSATMDRLLRAEKAKGNNRKHCSRTKPGSLLALILGGLLPGTLGCVSRVCRGGPGGRGGGQVTGDFGWTLTVTVRTRGTTTCMWKRRTTPSSARSWGMASMTHRGRGVS